VPEGSHRLRVLVGDAGGGVTASAPMTVAVDNTPPGPPVPNGSPASDPARLTACLERKRPCGRRRPRDRRRLVTAADAAASRLVGRLTTPAGVPIVGARLEIRARTRIPGARPRSIGTVVTGREGRYSFRVPRGASRNLAVSYRAFLGAADTAARASAELLVRAAVRLRIAPTSVREGDSIAIRGTLPGRPRPRRGKLVELQARTGGAWRTFATTRAARATGRFAHRHRFPVAGVRRTHRLRARVPREASYPYVAGNSRAIEVTILPSG
jgi:hypothetical protein